MILMFNSILAEALVPLHFGWGGKHDLHPNSWNIDLIDLKLGTKV